MSKKSFILHVDSLGILEELTDEQAGQLFKLIYQYFNPNKPKQTQITQMVNLVFYPFKTQFDRDIQAYSNIVERNKLNGQLGGRPKKKNPRKPKKADSDSDSDNKNDKDKEKDRESNNDKDKLGETPKTPLELKFDEYLKFRKAKKVPVLPESLDALKKKLWKLSGQNTETAIEILNESIANGWTGVFQLKDNQNNNNGKSTTIFDALSKARTNNQFS